MKKLWFVAVLALAAGGCSKAKPDDKSAKAHAKSVDLAAVSVTELDGLLAKGGCTPVDANGEATRKKRGVIPGAVKLTDYETYSAAELPADKARPLVFYCANEQCGASHTAAEKAVLAGYKDVRVLPAGILGWVAAGKPVDGVEPGA
jgi:rhodanese-related sulfurtransferase